MDIDLPLSSRRYLGVFACCKPYTSRVCPNAHRGVTILQDMAQHPYREAKENVRFVGLDSYLLARCDVTVGSKTCNGLTYLKLALLNIQWLRRVSEIQLSICFEETYQVGNHDLGLSA